MTEELVKEADKYADDYATPDLDCSFRAYMFEASKEGYLAGAEPREKQIQIDAEQIRALQKQNGELTDRVRELEKKIEKMKHTEQKVMDKLWKEWDMLLGVSN